MKLGPEWGRVLRHAWSIRLNVLAFLLTLMQAGEQFLPAIKVLVPEPHAGVITATVILAAIVARLIPQRTISHGNHQDQGRRR